MKKCVLGDYILDMASGPFGSNLKVECFVSSGFPIIDGANLYGVRVTDNVTKFVTEEKARSLSRSIAKRHDVIVTISGTLGQVAYIPSDSLYEEYLCSQRQFRVTFDESKIDVEYLVNLLHTDYGQKKILSFANYVGVPALSQPLPNFRRIELELPAIEKQHEIANIISTIDRKIALNRKRIATLEAMAKEIYDYWFVQFDFPDAHGRPYKSSGGAMVYNPDLKREIPKGWEVKALGKLMKTNASSYSDRTLPSRIKYIDISAVSNGVISSKTEYDRDSAPGRARRIANRGDTIWSSVRPNLKAYALVLNPQEDDVFSTGFTVLSPVDVPYGFLYFTVTAEAYVSYLVSRAGNSAYPAVLPSAFGEYEIAVPPRDLLDRFACQTEGMFELRQNCFDETQSLSSLRDFLLPLLMNGQVKVG